MFSDSPDFYPTPKHLTNKMLSNIDFKTINSVLEPSAGKGDLVEGIINKFKNAHSYYNRDAKWDIDTIEIDENLQYVLRGKGYRVVYNNFLEFNTYKKYDLIVANFPFSEGEKHLLKALEMQQNGGKIVCLINAETLRNPYSNTRKDLINKLDQYNAEIEYISNAFTDAERQTGVEVALIKIDIPNNNNSSIILDELKREELYREEPSYNNSDNIIEADFIKGIIQRYNFEVKAGLKLIAEYRALEPLMLKSLKDDYYNKPVLKLGLENQDRNCTLENAYIKQIRMKYWRALFTSDEFMGLFTSNLRHEYYNKIEELKDYDFSLYNIYTIKIQLHKAMIKGVEDTILNLFEELSYKHSWNSEYGTNIHYYNGWKTNEAYKINDKKVIIPLSGFSRWDGRIDYDYKVLEKLSDIEKVFDYLQYNESVGDIDLSNALKMAGHYGETKKIELKYFYCTFYKKGTCHIHWKYPELIKKFNIFGCQRKEWLPPAYSKKKYKDMTSEEKAVINEFEGEMSYNEVMNNREHYIIETSELLMLA